MADTIKFELTGDQAKLLSDLLEECVQELRATNEIMAHRQVEIDRLRDETDSNIVRLQERAKRGCDVETILGSLSATAPAQ